MFSYYLFFRDVDGDFSIKLDENYYYNSRNSLIDKSKLEISFMNETNLSLLILTSIYYILFFLNNSILKLVLFFSSFLILLILASRTAVITLIIILLINYYDKIRRNKFLTLLSGFFVITIFISTINVFEIPYISTFFNRTFEKSFGSDIVYGGLEGRFSYYITAYENSQYLFNINGYKFLLNKYDFSAHNEILGHTSAVGLVPAILYFITLFLIIKNSIRNIKFTHNNQMQKIITSMIVSYIIIGLTENIYIANLIWVYLFLFTLGYTSIINNEHGKQANCSTKKTRNLQFHPK